MYLGPYIVGSNPNPGELELGIASAVNRAVVAVPLHIGTSMIMGVTMGWSKFVQGRNEAW